MDSRNSRPASSAPRSLRRRDRRSSAARPMLDPLEPRTLLTAAIGNVEVFTAGAISGWAKDPDSPSSSISVRITVDGVAKIITADGSRADLGGNFGFSYNPALAPGNHAVKVEAIDAQSNIPTVLRSAIVANARPVGVVDAVSASGISGWAYDADNAGPVTIRIDKNGTTVQTITADQARADLKGALANHAFNVAGDFSGTIDVYAIDTPSGNAVLLFSNNKKVVGSVDVLTRTVAQGWAFDPDNPNTAITIRIKIDGKVVSETAANLERPDIAKITGGTTAHGFNIPISVPPGRHSIQVFAVEPGTSSLSESLMAGIAGVSNPAPVGNLEVASKTLVSGWVYDPDAGANPITVQVKVDGTVVQTVTANQPRPDLAAAIGSANHGFVANLSGLAAGPHLITVEALDNPTGTNFKFGQRVIDNTKPIGNLDVANTFNLSGWAVDVDSPNSAVQVIFDIDGTRYPAITADQNRPDLTFLSNTNHGFSTATPTHLFGTHTVKLIAVDTFDGSQKVIISRTFTNHPPVGTIETASKALVSGWVADPDDFSRSIEILVRIDGTIASRITASNNRPDLVKALGSANHGYSFSLTNLTAGAHLVEIFGVDPATGVTALIGARNIVA